MSLHISDPSGVPRSLSDFGRPACESACVAHISVDSWSMERLWAVNIVENLSSHSRILASTAKARQAPRATAVA